MAIKISELNSSSLPLTGDEVVPLVQGLETKKVTVNDLLSTNINSTSFIQSLDDIESEFAEDFADADLTFGTGTFQNRIGYGTFEDAIGNEDFAAFKEPILLEAEGDDNFVYVGTSLVIGESGRLVNGIFVGKNDVFGPGNYMKVESNEENFYNYYESLETGFISTKYYYEFGGEDHTHILSINFSPFGFLEIIQLTCPDDAESWLDVNIVVRGYQTQP